MKDTIQSVVTMGDTSQLAQEKIGLPRDKLRKITKPLMERRRRERINVCLNQLKSLVLEAMNQNNSQFSKLEKADILEMTVKHLRTLQRHQLRTSSPSNQMARYQAGYGECAREVARCLTSFPGVTGGLRQNLLGHLSQRLDNVPALQTSLAPSLDTLPASPERTHQVTAHIQGHTQTKDMASSVSMMSPIRVQPLYIHIPHTSSPTSVIEHLQTQTNLSSIGSSDKTGLFTNSSVPLPLLLASLSQTTNLSSTMANTKVLDFHQPLLDRHAPNSDIIKDGVDSTEPHSLVRSGAQHSARPISRNTQTPTQSLLNICHPELVEEKQELSGDSHRVSKDSAMWRPW